MKAQRATFRAKNVGIAAIVAITMVISGLSVIPTAPVSAQESIGGEFGGDYKVAINEQPNTLNPLNVSANESAQGLIDLLYDSLGRIDPYTLELTPWVAKAWAVDASNQSIVTVTLKKDVLWHDSTLVTVQDVNYTFGPSGYNIGYIAGTVLDPANNTITFHLSAPTALFFSQILQMKLIPVGFNLSWPEHGCGPYYLDEIVTTNGRQTWKLAAFENYFVGRPYLDSIKMIYYDEGIWSNVTKTGAGYDLLNGTVDFIGWDLTSNETSSTLIDIPRPSGNTSFLANPDEKNTSVFSEPGFEYYYLGMNNNQSHLLNNVELRKAIAHCIDKSALTNFDISGGLIIADSIVNPLNTPWYNTSQEKFDFDIAEANSILFNAGFLDIDDDGFRELPNREEFSFELLIPPQTEYFNAKAYGQLISSWLNSTGINTTAVEMGQTDRAQRILDNNFDLFLELETRAKIDPFFLYDMFHSSKIGGASDTNQLNFIGRAREIQGIVSVDNMTLVGTMNHTNIFDDGSANIEAYRNGEIWGKAERQPVWTANATFSFPVALDLKNTSVDDGYYVYMNRTISEGIWNTSLINTSEPKADATATQVSNEWLAGVNTTYYSNVWVNSSDRTTISDESVDVNYTGGLSNLTSVYTDPTMRSVENGTLHMWMNGTANETLNFANVGERRVLIVDADNYNDGDVAFYNSTLNNLGITDAYTWDVYGDSLSGDIYVNFSTGTNTVVVSATPADGATSVSTVGGDYVIQFSEPMDTSAGTINTNLPGVSWVWDGTGMWYNGTYTDLSSNTIYYVDLSSGGFQNLATTNSLTLDMYFEFSTGNFMLPRISFTTPADGATSVSTAAGTYSIQFSEPMDTSLGTASTDLPDVSWSWDGTGMWYNGTYTALSAATTYYVDLTGGGFAAACKGKPNASVMAAYNLVIWVPTRDMTGNGTVDPLTAADETEIATYLDGGLGRNFFLSNIWYTTYTSYTGSPGTYSSGNFSYDYLGIQAVNTESTSETTVQGNATDAVFVGFGPATQNWDNYGWGGSQPWQSDEISGPGLGTICMENDGGVANGIRYDNGFKTIFFGFPFETLPSDYANDSMSRILNWTIPPGYEAQLGKGAASNENIVAWNVFYESNGTVLQNTTDYTLDPATGLIETTNLYSDPILANYTFTIDMQEGLNYNMTAYWYSNGTVSISTAINASSDHVEANYVWYNETHGNVSGLPKPAGYNIINNCTLLWSKDGSTPSAWPGANYTMNYVTGVVNFTQPLGPGEKVTANYTCFNTTYYGVNTLYLDHGAENESIYSPNFVLKRNDTEIGQSGNYTLDNQTGVITLAFTLTYGDSFTASYWYYNQSRVITNPLFALQYGSTPTEDITNFQLYVNNTITHTSQIVLPAACGTNLIDGTFYWNMSAGETLNVTYSYYDPASIVYELDLGNPDVVPGTLRLFKTGLEIAVESYTINLATGHISLNQSNISLLPTDSITATYSFYRSLYESYSLNQTSGILDLTATVQNGDQVLADYTYTTYVMLDNETGTIQIVDNFNVTTDNLTMSFDYRKFDELIELFNSQMSPDLQSRYVKEAQAFIAEMTPSVPLFSFKVQNALNNTRYDGFVSMVGGRINFWTYVNLRNKVVGEMQVSVKAQENFITETEQTTLEIRVEDLDGNTVPNAEIAFDGEGTFGDVSFDWDDTNGNGLIDSDETGIYKVDYTAPATTVSRTVLIQATATRPSYVKGTGEFQMTVHPKIQQFNIEILRGAAGQVVTSIDSGNETAIRVIVTDKDTGSVVTNARVSLSISPLGLGGYLNETNGTTDSTGTFETVFGAINVTVDTTFTISATVSKTGYLDSSQMTSISVYRDPDIEAPGKGFLGLPAPSLIFILVLLAGLSVLYARRKKR